jgi:hypothetical protein
MGETGETGSARLVAALHTNGQKRNLSCRKEIKLALDTKMR